MTQKQLTAVWVLVLCTLIIISMVGYVWHEKKSTPQQDPVVVLSFNDCVRVGYLVLESSPRQCKTPDGRTYAEEIPEKITYSNSSSNDIVPELPFPGAVTGKTFTINGKARGTWYFEASFPIRILDEKGAVLITAVAQAQSDWMTTEFVPFKVEVSVPSTYTGKATLVMQKDNPSGLPERDAFISFPITIEY